MDYQKIRQLSKLVELGDKVVAAEEFIEIRVGVEELGGFNLRLKGKTVYCNIEGLPSFEFDLPQAMVDKGKQALAILKQRLKDEANAE